MTASGSSTQSAVRDMPAGHPCDRAFPGLVQAYIMPRAGTSEEQAGSPTEKQEVFHNIRINSAPGPALAGSMQELLHLQLRAYFGAIFHCSSCLQAIAALNPKAKMAMPLPCEKLTAAHIMGLHHVIA